MSDSGPIYLDYNATAPIKPEVVTAVSETMMLAGNPSSVHGFGRDVRKRIEDAREQIAALIGCSPPELVFTAGGTEANNTALSGAGRRVLIVSAIEHPAVLRTAEAVAENTSSCRWMARACSTWASSTRRSRRTGRKRSSRSCWPTTRPA